MGLEQYRERVTARIAQAMQRSGVDLSALSAGDRQRLIDSIGDGVLLEFDAMIDDLVPATQQQAQTLSASQGLPAAAAEEEIVWQGRPFLSLLESYVVTTERVRIFRGLLSRTVENLELVRLQDVDYRQGISERMLNIGDVTLRSADPSNAVLELRNVANPEQVQEIIRRVWLDARRRHGVLFREEM